MWLLIWSLVSINGYKTEFDKYQVLNAAVQTPSSTRLECETKMREWVKGRDLILLNESGELIAKRFDESPSSKLIDVESVRCVDFSP